MRRYFRWLLGALLTFPIVSCETAKPPAPEVVVVATPTPSPTKRKTKPTKRVPKRTPTSAAVGIGTPAPPSATPAPPSATPAAATPSLPKSSRLSKIVAGMTMEEVRDRAGAPNAQTTLPSKIPFSKKGWVTYYYKGQGRVVFAVDDVKSLTGARVERVEIDADETGAAR